MGGCGREDVVCCQGLARTALKLYGFNPPELFGGMNAGRPAGRRAAASEAFQEKDAAMVFFVLIKRKILATASSFVSHRNSFEMDFDLEGGGI